MVTVKDIDSGLTKEMNTCKLEISFVVKESMIEAKLYDRDDKCLPYEIIVKVPFQRQTIVDTTEADSELLKNDLVY